MKLDPYAHVLATQAVNDMSAFTPSPGSVSFYLQAHARESMIFLTDSKGLDTDIFARFDNALSRILKGYKL
jgi:hypothetical protein